jgi:twitching motility protein PilI
METLKHVGRTDESAEPGAAPAGEPLPGGTADAAEAEASRQILQRMCFRVGDLGLLFPFSVGREVITPPAVSRVPNTASWFRGLANVRGTLVPVIDAADAFDVTNKSGTPPYVLIFGHGENAIGLLIDGLPRSLDIDASAVVADPPAVPRLLGDSVTAAYETAGRTWLEVDVDVLFDALAGHVASEHGDDRSGDAQSGIN